MIGTSFLAYFEGNLKADRAPDASLARQVPRDLHARLAASLGRFQLGEAAGGKIHEDIAHLRDRALDAATRRSVQLYIEEEWRHSRELALVIRALGGELLTAHWTNGAFTACRRLLGLRTKMMTLAIAEVVGIVYYRALARGVGSPALATSLCRIADEESRHLDFQAAFFDRAIELTPRWARAPYRWLLCALMNAIFAAALLVLLLDHGRLLRRLGTPAQQVLQDCRRELGARSFLRPGRGALAGDLATRST